MEAIQLNKLHQNYKRQIMPIFEMLVHKKYHLNANDWISFVELTKHSILKNPQEYLYIVPRKDILDLIIQRLFDEFKNEMMISTRRSWFLNESIESLSKFLHVLGYGMRLKIAFLLHERGELGIDDLCNLTGINNSDLIREIKKLKSENIIISVKIDKSILYSVNSEHYAILSAIFDSRHLRVSNKKENYG